MSERELDLHKSASSEWPNRTDQFHNNFIYKNISKIKRLPDCFPSSDELAESNLIASTNSAKSFISVFDSSKFFAEFFSPLLLWLGFRSSLTSGFRLTSVSGFSPKTFRRKASKDCWTVLELVPSIGMPRTIYLSIYDLIYATKSD